MDTIVYLATATITVVWSVWIYLWWETRAGLAEETGLRLVLIVAPSTYFLLIAVSGWSQIQNLRLDLVGLVLLDSVTILSGILLAVLVRVPSVSPRQAYLVLLTVYNLIAAVEIIVLYVVRNNPLLLARAATFIGEWQSFDFFSFHWLGGRQQATQPELAGLLNKILIALLSYIPVSLIRYVASVRRRRKLERELSLLKQRVDVLEQQLTASDPGVVK